jgi:hypothetical protein
LATGCAPRLGDPQPSTHAAAAASEARGLTVEGKPSGNAAHDIAVKIYVELVARNTEITPESVKLTASAANIATLSIKLAEAFLQVEHEAILAREPVKNHNLDGADTAQWLK